MSKRPRAGIGRRMTHPHAERSVPSLDPTGPGAVDAPRRAAAILRHDLESFPSAPFSATASSSATRRPARGWSSTRGTTWRGSRDPGPPPSRPPRDGPHARPPRPYRRGGRPEGERGAGSTSRGGSPPLAVVPSSQRRSSASSRATCPLRRPDRAGKRIEVGSIALDVIETPATRRERLLRMERPGGAPILFSGDTLFWKGIGRTDLWGGLPDDPRVDPGTGSSPSPRRPSSPGTWARDDRPRREAGESVPFRHPAGPLSGGGQRLSEGCLGGGAFCPPGAVQGDRARLLDRLRRARSPPAPDPRRPSGS